MFVIPTLLISLPSFAIPAGNGFLMPTEYRTISRFQLALGAEAEYPLLKTVADDNAKKRPPRALKVLQVIVRKIDAKIRDKDGKDVTGISEMSPPEIARCREWFKNYQQIVFVCTRGALKVEPYELVINEPVKKLDDMGNNSYWMSGYDAVEGHEKEIKENYYDSITFYYKKPENMKAGLLGGAIGRDEGIRGAAFWTQWITDWKEKPQIYSGAGVVSLHEWMHNISYYSHRVMGYTAVPDCHAAEEYGYWDQDGGYRQWQAWNRDLIMHYITQEFWYKLDTRGKDLGDNPPAINRHIKAGPIFKWKDIADDWQAKLPTLSDEDLQTLTGLKDLKCVITQQGPNTNTIFTLRTSAIATGDPLKAPIQLDNVLVLGRRDKPSRLTDPYGGYPAAPLEGMAILRIPNAPKDRQDLLLIRPDLAPYVLPLLKVRGRKAENSIIGFLNRQDPAEKQQVNMFVALVDFGETLPKDELAAIGR